MSNEITQSTPLTFYKLTSYKFLKVSKASFN